MIILKQYRLMERIIGLDSLGGRESVFVRIIYLVFLISISVMESTLIVSNIRDSIERAAPAVVPLCGGIASLSCYIHLLVNRHSYYALLNKMQQIVDTSAR